MAGKTETDYVAPIKMIPEEERPYEKCWACGEQSLTDSELFSVILKSGALGESALDLSRRLLRSFGGYGINGLYHISAEQLMQIRGIGKVKAIQLKCIAEMAKRISRAEEGRRSLRFDDPDAIASYYMEEYRHEECEKVVVLFFDSGGFFIGDEEISKGTVNCSLVSPREVFLCALRRRSVSIALMHNHPSGNPLPSTEDIIITKRLREAGDLIGIGLLDHIILGDRTAFSFRAEGWPVDSQDS